ncbi:hypothetical protein [Legionella sp. km772]|uniref:hypothetical protein n=1 Tax=Legionella sp. km772 TaxID=2498111 RepID=UPI0013151DAF|nr:hypothetical protein [Legionella sp. km772]
MADNNSSSVVSIVAIIAILLIAGAVVYFLFINSNTGKTTKIDIQTPTITAPTTGKSAS